jgi:hypothetical protein
VSAVGWTLAGGGGNLCFKVAGSRSREERGAYGHVAFHRPSLGPGCAEVTHRLFCSERLLDRRPGPICILGNGHPPVEENKVTLLPELV